MRVLVVGSGGREHALSWKLAQEAEVFCAPGNPGIAGDVETCPVAVADQKGLLDLAARLGVDYMVIGPEVPLIAGLADAAREAGLKVVGPGAQAAQLEGSKAFAKSLMAKAGIPTARYISTSEPGQAKLFCKQLFDAGKHAVVKASGLAQGKGAFVCEHLDDAESEIDAILLRRELGEAGDQIVIEERLLGREFSLLTLVSGQNTLSLPVAQDYKRAFDGDSGPNTGGMGSYSPLSWVDDNLILATEEKVVQPILRQLQNEGIEDYRGVLFSGLMVVKGQPFCLEYNVRFGDPETQSIVLRLGTGLAEALHAVACGEPIPPIVVQNNAAVTVVVASEGYPGNLEKGLPIQFDSIPENVKFFHSGTGTNEQGHLVTNGGRVVCCSAEGYTSHEARELAYAAARTVHFQGARFRHDIGLEVSI